MIDDPALPGDTRGRRMEPVFESFFQWSESKNIPVVIAAGNEVHKTLHRVVPQKFGTTANRLITVGGVEKDGSLFQITSPQIPGELGSMTVFSPAREVTAPGNDGQLNLDSPILNTGTSQAAALTVSLA
jgi:hypothetical protein